jgi:peptidoglycan/LPS O-acetylase OafA/YrhL
MKNLLRIEIPSNRIFGLDLLRAIAILAVIFGHGQQFLPSPFKSVFYYLAPDGVTIFFVLSGFLIGNILLKMLQHDPLQKRLLFQFWKRRWMRTLPNYYLALIILCIVHLLFDPSFTMQSAWKHFIFSQNLLTNQDSSFFQESWSLSIEEWFYLLIPALLFLLFYFFKPGKQKAVLLFCIFGSWQ